MDELVIGDKKYLSSKQAAKVTGYAKDYIGQLCREGRVPARLVGRSWYVLESALHDHRFGDQKVAKETPAPVFPSTWESPKYSAAPVESDFPQVNRLKETEEVPFEENTEEHTVTAQHLQDSWKAWFDRVAEAAPAPSIPDVVPEKKAEEPVVEAKEVSVPIRAVYQKPPEELLPRRNDYYEEEYEREEPQRTGRKFGATLQIAGALVALVMASLAVVGSGYFDAYIISNSQVGMIAGVSQYNR